MFYIKNIAEYNDQITQVKQIAFDGKLLSELLEKKNIYQSAADDIIDKLALVNDSQDRRRYVIEARDLYFKANKMQMVLQQKMHEQILASKRENNIEFVKNKGYLEEYLYDYKSTVEHGESLIYSRLAFCNYYLSDYDEVLNNIACGFEAFQFSDNQEDFTNNITELLGLIYDVILDYEKSNKKNDSILLYEIELLNYLEICRVVSNYQDNRAALTTFFEQRLIVLDNKETLYRYLEQVIKEIVTASQDVSYTSCFFRKPSDFIVNLDVISDYIQIVKKHCFDDPSARGLIELYEQTIQHNYQIQTFVQQFIKSSSYQN